MRKQIEINLPVKLIGSLFFVTVGSNTIAAETDLIVIEAENFYNQVQFNEHYWESISSSIASNGKSLKALPDTGALHNKDFETNSPRLDYSIEFSQSGTYYVWVRGVGESYTSDSLHVGLNNQAVKSASRIGRFYEDYTWSNKTMDGLQATIYIANPGKHTVNVWMREDGFVFDQIQLVNDSSFDPETTQIIEDTVTFDSSGNTITTLESVGLSWDYPSISDLSDVAGFVVYMSSEPGSYTKNDIIHKLPSSIVSESDSSYVYLSQLEPGNYYLMVTAYNSAGMESKSSEELKLNVVHP